jgi:hypothetical protein
VDRLLREAEHQQEEAERQNGQLARMKAKTEPPISPKIPWSFYAISPLTIILAGLMASILWDLKSGSDAQDREGSATDRAREKGNERHGRDVNGGMSFESAFIMRLIITAIIL